MKDTTNNNHLNFIIDAIMEPLLYTLKHSFINQDSVMQAQLSSLLKIILFEKNLMHQE